MEKVKDYAENKKKLCAKNDAISKELFLEYGVKRGLRDEKGQGVLTGLTNISAVNAFKMIDGVKTPSEGELLYRGYDVKDLVHRGFKRGFLFEEGAYLLLFGELPTEEDLQMFHKVLSTCMKLPNNFTKDVIMKTPTADVMNTMTKSILTLSSYDKQRDNLDISNVLRQCLQLIAVFPMLAGYGYHAYNHYVNNQSMYIHRPDSKLSVAANFLRILRPDTKYTELEEQVLDVALLLHMEHGGGNNSTFTTRVVTSSGSDTYSAIAAAMSSLKGHKHGGANLMVRRMMDDLKQNITDMRDDEQIERYLRNVLHGEAFDGKGLIYGMGHAVYSLSDPREVVFKSFVEKLARAKGKDDNMYLYNAVERLAPSLIAEERKIYKGVSPNVDFYSGFVYELMNIPQELFTPLFAIARIVGWSAHRLEELLTMDKIIRPGYRSLVQKKEYIDLEQRQDG